MHVPRRSSGRATLKPFLMIVHTYGAHRRPTPRSAGVGRKLGAPLSCNRPSVADRHVPLQSNRHATFYLVARRVCTHGAIGVSAPICVVVVPITDCPPSLQNQLAGDKHALTRSSKHPIPKHVIRPCMMWTRTSGVEAQRLIWRMAQLVASAQVLVGKPHAQRSALDRSPGRHSPRMLIPMHAIVRTT